MTKKECEHDWDFRIPFAPNKDGNYVHVEVEAHCEECGEIRTSDYSWSVEEYYNISQEGDYEAYECDRCEVEMDYEGEFTEYEDMHFCSKKCYAEYWGEEE